MTEHVETPPLRSCTRDGLTFEVVDGGPRDGEVVVLLHGFPQDATAWRAVSERLHASGFRTLAPDQRGYSPAASPTGVAAYRVSELVRDVLALVDAAGVPQVHLVGHDWGGAVAWATALTAPERLSSLTVLSTPHPTAMERAMRSPDQARRSWYMLAFQVPGLPEQVLARSMRRFLTGAGLPVDHAERYAARFATPSSLRGPISWYRASAPWRGVSRSRAGGSGRDPRVLVPTTYVWGRHDVALGRAAAESTAEFVSADYRFVELDAGHWLPECNPAEVADEIVARATAPR
ncbi:alpha/beta fold hydrolase [Arsenicicoccus sp. oral taxon 190]|uniref:alpha/beta fold hydrolase n=1 Tax=Arsenicicoccus sp. oral taxon 190 TaxID=1658671 RepID=UPI00067A3BA8|nr:alpha/beta fold hydrolase [Arsenicicoccus sp. oral taxon 190]AKT51869.1 alpha/beta hydrolase [Arsenicicoccus sp. oral taxon 190]